MVGWLMSYDLLLLMELIGFRLMMDGWLSTLCFKTVA